MINILKNLEKHVSAVNFKKHKAAVGSLIAQVFLLEFNMKLQVFSVFNNSYSVCATCGEWSFTMF